MKFLNITTRLLLTISLLFSFILAPLTSATSYADQQPTTSQNDQHKNDKKKSDKKKQSKKKAIHKKDKSKKAAKETTKIVTQTQTIAFASQQQQDPNLAQGQTREVQAGKNGTETLKYKITYKNKKQTKKTLVSRAITIATVPQITAVGTYVAPPPPPAPAPAATNTYTNVDGNQIESPSSNSSGATGVCRDGSYTHAVHHQGACSSHGGVDHWL